MQHGVDAPLKADNQLVIPFHLTCQAVQQEDADALDELIRLFRTDLAEAEMKEREGKERERMKKTNNEKEKERMKEREKK